MHLSERFTSHAFLIGVNAYEHHPTLYTPINDVLSLGKILGSQKTHSYIVHPLLGVEKSKRKIYQGKLNNLSVHQRHLELAEYDVWDTTKKGIERFFDRAKTIIDDGIGKQTRVLFYFAGHGIAIDDDNPKGFILPANAKLGDETKAISMYDLLKFFNELDLHHFLLILDCCFAGSFRWATYTRSSGRRVKKIYQEHYNTYLEATTYQVLTSSSYNQEAIDMLLGVRSKDGENSPFAKYLIQGLQGEADTNKNGLITATELYFYIRTQLEKHFEQHQISHNQTPTIFPLEKHSHGEYIFLSPKVALNLTNYNSKIKPYKGLQAYEKKDSISFYGRDRVIEDLQEKLNKANFLIVSGASGTGKSSVIQAGLLPKIKKQNYSCACMRPGVDPRHQLKKAMKKLFKFKNKQKKKVLFVDQFEELITICRNKISRQKFLKKLQKLLEIHRKDLKVIISIRADFEPHFTQWMEESKGKKNLWREERYVVPHFETFEYREIIEQPALQHLIEFEEGLVNDIIRDLRHAPGGLPLLSFCLSELYEKFIDPHDLRNRTLTKKHYTQLGGLLEALSKKANTLYDSLDKLQKASVRKLMLRMIAVEQGETARRRIFQKEWIYQDNAENIRTNEVIEQLTKARLLVKGGDEHKGTFVEPAHDILVSSWPKLREWREDFGIEKLALQRKLWEDAKNYQRQEAPESANEKFSINPSDLWDSNPNLKELYEDLNSSNNWLNAVEEAFVKQSWNKRKDDKERLTLERNEARSTAWAGKALLIKDENPTHAIRIAEHAYNYTAPLPPTADSEQALLKLYYAADKKPFYSMIFEVSGTKICAVDISPDGNYILLGGDNSYAGLWSKDGREMVRLSPKNTLYVYAVAFSPNNKYILTAGDGMYVNVWNIEGKRALKGIKHNTFIKTAIFSPDSNHILTSSLDKIVRLWKIDEKLKKTSLERTYKGHTNDVNTVVFSQDGRYILSGGEDRKAVLWNFTGEKVCEFFEENSRPIETVAISPDNKYILTGGRSRIDTKTNRKKKSFAKLWDVATRSRLHSELEDFLSHDDSITTVAFVPASASNSIRILTSSADHTVKLWSLSGDLIKTFQGHTERISNLSVTSSGEYFLSGSDDFTAKYWKIDAIDKDVVFEGDSRIIATSYDYNNNYLIIGKAQETATIINLKNRKWHKLSGHLSSISSIAVAPDNSCILTGSYDNTIKKWNFMGELLQSFSDHHEDIFDLCFSPDGKYFLSGGDNTAILWDLCKGKLIKRLKGHKSILNAVAFSYDGKFIFTAGEDRTIRMWNQKGEHLHTFQGGHDQSILSIACSPNKDHFFTTGREGNGILWDIDHKKIITYFKGHTGAVNCSMFTPNGQYILTGGSDEYIKLWDLAGRDIHTFIGHQGYVHSLSISPDGQYFISGGNDKKLRRWKLFQPIYRWISSKNTPVYPLSDEEKGRYGLS